MIFKFIVFVVVVVVIVILVFVDEVNIYFYCQLELIKLLIDVFIEEIGVKVNVVFFVKGMVECL